MHALPVKFHMKSMFSGNLIVPGLYLSFNLLITLGILNIVHNVLVDEILNGLGLALIPISALTLIFYLLSAFTNPGLLIGDE